MILRDYQIQAVDAILRDFDTHSSTLCVSPTGTGKNLIGAETIRRTLASREGSVIWLAHREELLAQSRATIEAHTQASCELEKAEQKASEIFPADVLLASVQTMISGRNGSRRMHKFSPYNYSLIVCDETHHAVAKSWSSVLDYFKANKDLKVLGITATPERMDEEALGQLFESVAFDYSVLQAIRDGWLVPVQQQLIDIQSLDFSHIRTTAGDLNASDLASVMENERPLYGICDATMRELGQRKGIMFTASVRQAEMTCEIFNNRYRANVAAFASGKTPADDRARIMRGFHAGEFQLLVNCNLVSEGFDVPDAELLVQARPTKSKLLYQQQLGRIMRPLPGTVDSQPVVDSASRRAAIAASSKPIATVIDFCGNAGRHKLIHAIDVLGGNISDKVRELAETALRKSGRPQKVDELVLEAEKKEREDRAAREAARKARLTGKATYTIRMINPFDEFDLVAPPFRAWDAGKRLSEKQRAILRKNMRLDPDRFTYSEGKRLVDEFFYRIKNNLPSLPQITLLKKFDYDTHGMSWKQASETITQLKMNNWRRI